jgi:hypothetical protein
MAPNLTNFLMETARKLPSITTCEKCIWNNQVRDMCDRMKYDTSTWDEEEERWAAACSQWRRWE